MPLYPVSNQPYFPDPNHPALIPCGGNYCNPLQIGDLFYWQGYQTPCGISLVDDSTFSDLTLGTELVTNGNFQSGATGWTTAPALAWTVTGGVNSVALYDASVGLVNTWTQAVAITPGVTYRLVFTVGGITAGNFLDVFVGSTLQTLTISATGTYTVDVIAGADNTDLVFSAVSVNNLTLDNVSLKAITYADWDGNGEWNLSDGLACKSVTGTGLLEQITANYVTAGGYYKVTFTVSNYGGTGTLTPQLGGTAGTAVSSNGTFTQWITPGADGVLKFLPSSGFTGCISLEASTDGVYALRNDYIFSAISELGAGDSTDISAYIEYFEDYVTLIFDPEDAELPFECYIFEIEDSCDIFHEELVTNGAFDGTLTGWLRGNNAAQYDFTTPGQMSFIYPDPPVFAQVSIPLLFNAVNPLIIAPANYLISFEILANPDVTNMGVLVEIDTGQTTQTLFSTVGIHTLPVTYTTPTATYNAFRVRITANFSMDDTPVPPGTHIITITDVSLRRTEPFDATYTSECVKYDLLHRNTQLITGYCDRNNLGFEFENTGYKIQQRMGVVGRNAVWPKKKVLKKSGNGDAALVYSESEKFWELQTDLLSESALQGLADQVDCDHFLIGDDLATQKEYLAEAESLQPQYLEDGTYDLAPAIITLRIKENGMKFNRHY